VKISLAYTYFGAIKICKIILIVVIPFTADENVID
jgi:hypothetical protein